MKANKFFPMLVEARMAGPFLACMVILAGAVVTSPSAQAGIICDTARKLCEIIPTTIGKAHCDRLAEEVCSADLKGRQAEAVERLERMTRELHS